MAEVQSRDIHSTLDEFADALCGCGCGSKGADNLRTSAHEGEPSRWTPRSLSQTSPLEYYRSVAALPCC
ncbi:hypothetical protein NY08_784 [Rhodococcus sp. B7740]|nr:hypothetical protein NY08_784 [Rhodococcus sp. B7740]